MSLNSSAQQKVRQWLQDRGHQGEYRLQPVPGGDISKSYRLTTGDCEHYFIKHHPSPPDHFFYAETIGLNTIRSCNTILTPEVLFVSDEVLILEYIESYAADKTFWQHLGQQLAKLHAIEQRHFGFDDDNFCGLTQQINPVMKNGFDFFRQARLYFQSYLAYERGLLSTMEVRKIEKLGQKLEDLLPDQKPALIHGDLWVGNIHCGVNSTPYLIDPAAHYGWLEAELGMTLLFGGFDEIFYRSYEEQSNLQADWRQRAPIYNLYHLLNHLNLFGSGYHSAVMNIVNHYH